MYPRLLSLNNVCVCLSMQRDVLCKVICELDITIWRTLKEASKEEFWVQVPLGHAEHFLGNWEPEKFRKHLIFSDIWAKICLYEHLMSYKAVSRTNNLCYVKRLLLQPKFSKTSCTHSQTPHVMTINLQGMRTAMSTGQWQRSTHA